MRLFFIICFLSLCFCSFGQSYLPTQTHGARSHGMGTIRLNLQDSWSYFNNIGALARNESTGISVGYDSRFGLKELQTVSLAGNFPVQFGQIGFGGSRFGGKLFNQQSLGIGFSNQLGIVSFGIRADWFQTNIEGFGTGNSLIISFGGVAELGPKIFLSTHVSNVNRAKLSENTEERLDTQIDMGMSYIPNSKLGLHLELSKSLQNDPRVRAGLEYSLKDWVIFRTGIISNPGDIFFGLGLKPGKFLADYAFGQNGPLGSTHNLSIGWIW